MHDRNMPKQSSNLEQAQLKAFEHACTQDAPPACQSACPLHLDVRRLTVHMAAGEWNKGAALLEKGLPFAPLLTSLCEHPCERQCPRKDSGGAVAVNALEKACFALAGPVPPLKRLPGKGKTIAVHGCGFAALACAWEAALKGFAVRLFHEGPGIEEGMKERIAAVTGNPVEGTDIPTHLQNALDRLQTLGVEFFSDPERILHGRLLEGADAAFVDASAYPAFCPAEDRLDPVTGCVSGGDCKICYGGYADTVIMQAYEGKRGAITLGRVLGNSSPSALREHEGPGPTRLYADLAHIGPLPRLEPGAGVFTAAEAQAEASRCPPCNCLVCVKECAYLKQYGEYPKIYARQMFLNMGIYTGYRRMNKVINSCALCGQCEELCPEGFSMSRLCTLMREEMVRQRKMPPSAHFFALRELASATAPESVLALGKDASSPCSQVFFPGCQLAGSRKAQVRYIFRHLRQSLAQDTGIWLRCCGIPARHAAREDLLTAQQAELRRQWEGLGRPRVILACASCLSFFKDVLPEAQTVSLWEVLDREAPLAPPSGPPVVSVGSVHDPCMARHDRNWQNAVRSLLARAGVAVQEPVAARRTTACCGYGGLVWNANRDVSETMAAQRAGQLGSDALTSCIMCREQFIGSNKASWHLFDLLVPAEDALEHRLDRTPPAAPVEEACRDLPYAGIESGTTKSPGFSQRRENRIRLKNMIMAQEYGLETGGRAEPPWKLILAPGLLETLEAKHILRQDLADAVARAEEEGSLLYDQASGTYVARHASGPVTFWVSYLKGNDARQILDAWLHRMEIVMEPGI